MHVTEEGCGGKRGGKERRGKVKYGWLVYNYRYTLIEMLEKARVSEFPVIIIYIHTLYIGGDLIPYII